MVRVFDPVIESREAVEGHVGEIFGLHVGREAGPVLEREFGLVVGKLGGVGD